MLDHLQRQRAPDPLQLRNIPSHTGIVHVRLSDCQGVGLMPRRAGKIFVRGVDMSKVGTYTSGMRWKEQGERLRRWRKDELDISQEELARRIGCVRHRVSMMETGRDRPGIDLAARIELEGGPPCWIWAHVPERESVPA